MMKGNKYQDIFLSRIDEIEKCLENGLYLAALALALTLPDICGCAEYPQSTVKRHEGTNKQHKVTIKRHKITGRRYKVTGKHRRGICKCYKVMGKHRRGMCKCYIVMCKRTSKRYNKVGKRYKNWYNRYVGINEKLNSSYGADMAYLSGEVVYSLRNLFLHEGNPNIDKDKIEAGRCKIDHFSLLISNDALGDMSSVSYADNPNVMKRSYVANVKRLCLKLCQAARQYYKNNKEKFTFFQYDIHEID